MKTFYSLIKIAPNAASDDSLTIGLLLHDDNGFRYAFSKVKKNLARRLLSRSPDSIDFIEKQIILKIKEFNKLVEQKRSELLPYPTSLGLEYFNYLNKYNNGILQFSKPTTIDDLIDDAKFSRLFEMFVDDFKKAENKISTDRNISFYSRVDKNLIDKVQDQIHTKAKFDNNSVPSLITQFEMDCIGLNGTFIGAKSLPMFQSKQTLAANTSSYINIIVHLSLKFDKDLLKNNFYLISDEPSDISSLEHKIWEKLLNEQLFKVISSEELNQVVQKIEETRASVFLDTLIP